MFKSTLQKYLTKHNSLNTTTKFRYVNNTTAELTNTPIIETLYTILYTTTPLKFKLTYMFNWKKHS